MNAPVEHREQLAVRSYEVEADGRLRPVVLVRMLQEAAWLHAQMLGKGFRSREAGDLYWVLSRLRVRMRAYPRWGDRFEIRTYPAGTDRLLAIREFEVRSSDGATLGRAVTGWLVVDGGRGRPVRPETLMSDVVSTPRECDADLERLSDAPCETVHGPYPVRAHDIDQYRHVNNSAYLEWIIDELAAAALSSGAAADPAGAPAIVAHRVDVDYLQETVLADRYLVRLAVPMRPDDGPVRAQVERERDAQPTCRAVLDTRPAVDRAPGRR